MTIQTKDPPLASLVLLAEREQARQSFAAFLGHVRIEEPQGNGVGVVPFAMWPHLAEVAGLLAQHKLIVWMKARQIGATWLLAAYCVWTAMHKPSSVVLLLSQGELEAQELLHRCKAVWRLLPAHIKVELERESGERLDFLGGGRILALPSTEKAGQSFTATLVICDEADFHSWFETNLAAVKPTIDANGQLIAVSTSNEKTIDSAFKRLFRAAPGNGYKAVFYGWDARPGRDVAWYAKRKAEATDVALFEKHYPSTPEQALAAPQSIRAFDVEALDRMREDRRKPLRTDGAVTVWQKRIVGRRYCAFTDTSHGVGADYSVTCVMDAEDSAVVADVFSNVVAPEELADLSVKLLTEYDNPIWGIEDNDRGSLTIAVAKRLSYKNLYHLGNDPKKAEGWNTNSKTRETLWGELQEAVKAGHIRIWNEAGLTQFYDVIKNTEKDGRIEAISGGHDDYPFAVGGCWQMRRHAFSVESQVIEVRQVPYEKTTKRDRRLRRLMRS
jgi:hypothetical protein